MVPGTCLYRSTIRPKMKRFAILPSFTYRYLNWKWNILLFCQLYVSVLKTQSETFCLFASFYVSVLETENEAFLPFCQLFRVSLGLTATAVENYQHMFSVFLAHSSTNYHTYTFLNKKNPLHNWLLPLFTLYFSSWFLLNVFLLAPDLFFCLVFSPLISVFFYLCFFCCCVCACVCAFFSRRLLGSWSGLSPWREVLCTRISVRASTAWPPSVPSRYRIIWYLVSDAGYWILGARYWMLVTRC